MKKRSLMRLCLAAGLAAASSSAFAQAITTNQWYAAAFGNVVPSAIFGPPYTTGTNGPLPGGGIGDSIAAPDGSTWTITLTSPGYIVFTDLEASGDQFQVFINGVAATLASNNLSPSGQSGLLGGYTSGSTFGSSVGEDIGAALSDPYFSSGTFYLPAGTSTITANYLGSIGAGDVAFFASTVPEASTWAMMLAGFAGLGFVGYRRNKPAPVAA